MFARNEQQFDSGYFRKIWQNFEFNVASLKNRYLIFWNVFSEGVNSGWQQFSDFLKWRILELFYIEKYFGTKISTRIFTG